MKSLAGQVLDRRSSRRASAVSSSLSQRRTSTSTRTPTVSIRASTRTRGRSMLVVERRAGRGRQGRRRAAGPGGPRRRARRAASSAGSVARAAQVELARRAGRRARRARARVAQGQVLQQVLVVGRVDQVGGDGGVEVEVADVDAVGLQAPHQRLGSWASSGDRRRAQQPAEARPDAARAEQGPGDPPRRVRRRVAAGSAAKASPTSGRAARRPLPRRLDRHRLAGGEPARRPAPATAGGVVEPGARRPRGVAGRGRLARRRLRRGLDAAGPTGSGTPGS